MNRVIWICLLLSGCGASQAVTDAGGGLPDMAVTQDMARAVASGCVSDVSPGDHVYDCDGIKYNVAVPEACVQSGCGLIVDVHGFTMSGKMEDNNTGMRALGRAHGYIVIQPNANPAPPLASWKAGTDDDKIFALMQLVASVFHTDANRMHFTGFSQGGAMTWRFLCKHSDVLASVAPAAEAACKFSGGDVPAREIPVLFMHGTNDALVGFNSVAVPERDALIAGWKMDAGTMIGGDASFKRTQYKNAGGNVFEFLQHDYAATSGIIKGHCYPGSQDEKGGEPGQLFGFACVGPNGFTWGEEVMKFFMAHPWR